MKPIIIIPPEIMSENDIKLLRENELCVVVATDPAKVRFLDPIPAASNRSNIERAAILMSRRLINGLWNGNVLHKSDFANLYVDLLIKGTPLDAHGTTEEQEQQIFNDAKADEIRRLAREEAKAERLKKKATEAKKS